MYTVKNTLHFYCYDVCFSNFNWQTLVSDRIDLHILLWLEILKGRAHSHDLGVDGRIILERILGK